MIGGLIDELRVRPGEIERNIALAIIFQEPEANIGNRLDFPTDARFQILLGHVALALVHEINDEGRLAHLAGADAKAAAQDLAAINQH